MTEHRLPWQIHPALTEQRLRTLGRVILQARRGALAEYKPENGDNSWSLGCTVYARTCHAIARAAIGEDHSWLSVVENDGLRFVLSIGGVPLRFCRGILGRPPSRSLIVRCAETAARQRAFEFMETAEVETLLRLVVEIGDGGDVASITLVQVDSDGIPHNPWSVPLEEAPVASINRRIEPKKLAPPVVGSSRRKKEEPANGS